MPSISDRSAAGSSSKRYRRKLLTATKPAIEIHIDNHYRSKVYTSASTVTGHISITAPQQQQERGDVRFDSIQILLLGTTRTRIDGHSIPQTTAHTFLKLIMPVPASHYPVPRALEAGRTYVVPFHFVVPSHLTINACAHSVANHAVRDYHTRLPPTMGSDSWDRDDLAPDMSRVEYAIKARVLRGGSEEGGGGDRVVRLFEASQEIRVLPVHPAEPPLSLAQSDKLYATSKTKTMRRTILSSKMGKVTVSAAQPPAAMLSPDGREGGSTTARLDLRFEPAAGAGADGAPPKVTSITSKVTAVTYFSASGVRCLPNLGDWNRSFGYEASGSYSNTTSLSSSIAAPQVVWKQQHQQLKRQTTQERRDSGYGSDTPSASGSDPDQDQWGGEASKRSSWRSSTKSIRKPAATATSPTPAAYTASLQVPIQLPLEKRMFLPTFHSCITSRAYVLWLTVSLSCGGSGTSKLMLAVPLQIGVEAAEVAPPGSSPGSLPAAAVDRTGLPSFETALREAEAEADEHLRPRVLSVPTVQFHRQPCSQNPAMALPGYAELMAGGVGSRARNSSVGGGGGGGNDRRLVAVCG
ncbi:hypothetical protein SLS62_002802 [Diatrype stigma]|uniref:Arrestin-like N-terminal domain-containing protein n=1 Tax=Diatrype stigma TaxID=117547 RepID=A0AAN9UXB9_9PEZI